MATLGKIRSKAGLLILMMGSALFAFIIGDFLNSGSTYFRQSQERIAEVDEEIVKIQDYQDRVDEVAEMYKIQSGSASLPEEHMIQIRQSVLDVMVQEVMLDEATAKLGMGVSSEKLFDMVQGENISPLIRRMQMFTNPQTGAFDKTALLNFLRQIDSDNIASYPANQQAQLIQAKNLWLFWEENIRCQRLEQKYTALLNKTIPANSLDAKKAYNDNAENSDIIYAIQSYATIPDSTIEVSKSEIEKLYNQREKLYKQKKSKVIKYITVNIRPNREDYDKAQAEIESLKEGLATSERVVDVINENSETPYANAFLTEKALDPEMRQFATASEVGAVYGPVFENDKCRMFKLVDRTVTPDSVKVSHITLAGKSGAEITALTDSLMGTLEGGANFAELAKEYSTDQAAENGGELSWSTEVTALGDVNDDFEKAVFSTPLNEVAVVESLYGIHLVRVTEKTGNVEKYKIANIDITVSPSSKAYNGIYNGLNQFVSENNSMTKLKEDAKEASYNLISGTTVTIDDQLLGSTKNSRPMIRWAFQDDKGSISEIFECSDKFVVAAIEGSISEGYRPADMVAPALRAELAAQKKGDKIAQGLAAKNPTSVETYTETMGSSVDSVKFMNFGTRRIAGIDIGPSLNVMASMAQVDQVSTPVGGNNSVYVFKVYARDKDGREFNEAEEIRALDASNAYRVGFQAIQPMVNSARVEDNRIRFY